ncbi:MAG: hypothetical protein ACKOC5_16255 [Chloroflexota bacterium]
MTNKILVSNAIVFAALGVAFAVYGPVTLAFFNVPELEISQQAYWHLAAFARMFGAALFGWGMLLWAASRAFDHLPGAARRSILSAQVLANLMAGVVALTQQSSIWYSLPGWLLSGLFVLLTFVYGALSLYPPGASAHTGGAGE